MKMSTVGELVEALGKYHPETPLRVRESPRVIGALELKEISGRVVIVPHGARGWLR